jgi:hypothetical protein
MSNREITLEQLEALDAGNSILTAEFFYPTVVPEKKVHLNLWDWSRSLHAGKAVSSILDVGTGTHGVFDVFHWDKLKPEFKIALDIAEFPRDLQEGWHKIKADICNLPFADKSLDVIQCMETLEHMTRMQGLAALKELCRVARTLIATSSCGINNHLGPLNAADRKRNPYTTFRYQPGPDDYESVGFNWLYNAGGQMLAWKYLGE